uniref:Uncharacterized protein n=1 Tax=Cannabis sativa TaxID=3483 RepID=A0A803QRR9_CANSA
MGSLQSTFERADVEARRDSAGRVPQSRGRHLHGILPACLAASIQDRPCRKSTADRLHCFKIRSRAIAASPSASPDNFKHFDSLFKVLFIFLSADLFTIRPDLAFDLNLSPIGAAFQTTRRLQAHGPTARVSLLPRSFRTGPGPSRGRFVR